MVPVLSHACVRYLYGLYDELARHLRSWTWVASRMRSMLHHSILFYTLHTSVYSGRHTNPRCPHELPWRCILLFVFRTD